MRESGSGLVLGIDIGGTNTPLALMDDAGEVLWRDRLETRAEQPLSHLLDRLFQRVEAAKSLVPGDCWLRAVGVGAPNANALNGWVESPPNMCWGRVDLVGELSARFGVPVHLTNDANAHALAEWLHGAGRGRENLLVITLGTGLGSGLIVNGQLVHGASGHAGELGHVCVESGGRSCKCGLNGCLETWVSAGGMMRTASELGLFMRAAEPGATPSPKDLTLAAEAGDPIAAQVFVLTGEMLARGLADAVHLLSPSRIVLGGGINRAGAWILDPVIQHLPGMLMPPFRGTVDVVLGELDPDMAGVVGAAAWAGIQSSGKVESHV